MDMPNNHRVGGRGNYTNQQRPSSSALYKPPSSAPYTITGQGQLNAGFMPDIGVGQLNAGFVPDSGTRGVNAPYQPNRRHPEPPQVQQRRQGGRDGVAGSGGDSRRGQQNVPERVPTGIPNISSSENGALYPKLDAVGGDNKYNEIHNQPQGLSRKTRLPSFAARYMRQKNQPRDTSQGNNQSNESTKIQSQPENQGLSRKSRLPSFASRYKRQKNEPREIRQGNDQPDEYTEIHSQPEKQGLSRKARLPSFAVRYMHRKKEPRERPHGNDESDKTRDEDTIQMVRTPSPDLPKSEPLCEFNVSRRIMYMVTAGVLIFLLLLLIILSATLTRSSKPPSTTPKTSSTTKAWTTGRVSTVTTGITSSTLLTTTTRNTVTTVPLPDVTATYLMECTIPIITDSQPIIDNMCWLSDTKLVIADSTLRVHIANVDVNGRSCAIQKTFTIANRSQEMECSDRGEFFIKTEVNNFFLVYDENGDPKGEWKPTDLSTSLNTIAINTEHIVTADYYDIALYDQNRQFLTKRERVVYLTNIVESYLSKDDMFWSSPKGEELKVYDLKSDLVNSVNIKSEHVSGTGDYVFVNDDSTKQMRVYTQGGGYVQGINIGGNMTTPDDMAIRKRLSMSDSIMALEDYSLPYGRYKIYQISMDFTTHISL